MEDIISILGIIYLRHALFARVVPCKTENNKLTITNGRYQTTRMLAFWNWALALFVISPCRSYSNSLQGKHLLIQLSEVLP
jgi:hypothetical protein